MAIAKDKIETHLKHYANELIETGFENEAKFIREEVIPTITIIAEKKKVKELINDYMKKHQEEYMLYYDMDYIDKLTEFLLSLKEDKRREYLDFLAATNIIEKKYPDSKNDFFIKTSDNGNSVILGLYQVTTTECDNLQEELICSFEYQMKNCEDEQK